MYLYVMLSSRGLCLEDCVVSSVDMNGLTDKLGSGGHDKQALI